MTHFLGLHALQALPLFTLMLGARKISERVRVRLTMVAAASYVSLFAILLTQALRGQPLFGPDLVTITMVAMWLTVTIGATKLAASDSGAKELLLQKNERLEGLGV